jgi:hypothetical protein
MNNSIWNGHRCPVCGKTFYIRTSWARHAWRTINNKPCCSYHCDRESNGLTGTSALNEFRRAEVQE